MDRIPTSEGLARPETAPSARYHYMDNLRALAMLAGIVFHAALAYSPLLHNLWLTADPHTSRVVDAVAWFTHLFRMPLFFLIAGFFCHLLMERRGAKGLMRNRALRIALPLVIFLPLVWITFGISIGWAFQNVDNLPPLLKMIAQMSDAPPPPPTTTHLWFLYYLVQFYIAYLALGALLRKLPLERLDWLVRAPTLVFVMPLLLVPALFSQVAPHPAPEQFTPQLWAYGFFGIFFLIGTQFYSRPQLIDQLRPYAPWMLVSSAILWSLVYIQLPQSVSLAEAMTAAGGGPNTGAHFLVSCAEAFVATHMTLVCLVVGKALLNRANAVMRFFADASYWLYLTHLPIVFVIQFILLDVDAHWLLEFAATLAGTLGLGLLSYVAFVRSTPVGWMLNGRKRSTTARSKEASHHSSTPGIA